MSMVIKAVDDPAICFHGLYLDVECFYNVFEKRLLKRIKMSCETNCFKSVDLAWIEGKS